MAANSDQSTAANAARSERGGAGSCGVGDPTGVGVACVSLMGRRLRGNGVAESSKLTLFHQAKMA
jgi:hypothetical protein